MPLLTWRKFVINHTKFCIDSNKSTFIIVSSGDLTSDLRLETTALENLPLLFHCGCRSGLKGSNYKYKWLTWLLYSHLHFLLIPGDSFRKRKSLPGRTVFWRPSWKPAESEWTNIWQVMWSLYTELQRVMPKTNLMITEKAKTLSCSLINVMKYNAYTMIFIVSIAIITISYESSYVSCYHVSLCIIR